MNLNFENTRRLLNEFDFGRVFVDELGWSRPQKSKSLPSIVKEEKYDVKIVAELSGVVVCEITGLNGIPDSSTRKAIHRDITKRHHENLLIFVDTIRTQSLWYWVKRVEKKQIPRDHLFCKGQPADLFLGKLNQMVFDLSEFDDDGNVSVVDVAKRLQDALDIDRVTKKFFRDFQEQHVLFLDLINGIKDERQRRWYASVLLNRLMFIYFLQKKPPGFLDNGNLNYLRDKLVESKKRGKDRYYTEFLKALFFEGFAKEETDRSVEAKKLVGSIKYLNGGLFLPHNIERENTKISIPDKAFENLFDLFERYSWHLDDTPGGQADEINPDVLGYIFEKYINQKAFGAYYTRPEITEYLCERTIHRLVLDAVKKSKIGQSYESLAELLIHLDASLCHLLVDEVLPSLSLLDPACGSGAFLVAAMRTLINIYSAVIGKIKFLKDADLIKWLKKIELEHPSISYYIKKRVITDNLYGVDIMEEATEIARLRLFLALVSSARTVDDLEPLPNIDFNVLPGNSLIGLIHVDANRFAKPAKGKNSTKSFLDDQIADEYQAVLKDKNESLRLYREHSFKRSDDAAGSQSERLLMLRDAVQRVRKNSYDRLNWILAGDFEELGIKFEEAAWDNSKGKLGKAKKRSVTEDDLVSLHAFHWGFEFDQILKVRGGFDAIITNPPWEILKPNSKEFFEEYSEVVTKKKMTIQDFESEQGRLLEDKETRVAWEAYLSQFPHQSGWFRNSPDFANQISVVNGKKAGTDIKLYKLFVERCYQLLRTGGDCGIVIPSGIYTDLGAKQLRQHLFNNTEITGLFGFENRKEIFEGVHRSFKFVVLTFLKGGTTKSFPTAFMRLDVQDLAEFPANGSIEMPVKLIEQLSPDSLSVMEFRSEVDVSIATKMLKFPLLGETIPDIWNVKFTAEFHMTNDSHLFHDRPGKGRLPLYEGKMIHQFNHTFSKPRYWIIEKDGRSSLNSESDSPGRKHDSQWFRFGFRDIARNTDERTMITTIIPPSFHGNKIPTCRVFTEKDGKRFISDCEQVFLTAIANSYVFDFLIRMRVTTTLNFFYLYQMPVPRLGENDREFKPLVSRAARLICTAPEFDDFAKECGLRDHHDGVTDATSRGRLRAELDGLVAHLYRLTEEEFAHVLSTFPLVADSVKVAAHNAYRDVEKGLVK